MTSAANVVTRWESLEAFGKLSNPSSQITGLFDSPQLPPRNDSEHVICVYTNKDRHGGRWGLLREKLHQWTEDVVLLKSMADAATRNANIRRRAFQKTKPTHKDVVMRRAMWLTANYERQRRVTDYEQCCDAINGAKELLDRVEVHLNG